MPGIQWAQPTGAAECASVCIWQGWMCTALCSQKTCAQPQPSSGDFKLARLWAQPAQLWHKPAAQVDSIRGLQGIKIWYIIRAPRLFFFIVVWKHSYINLMKLVSNFCWMLPRSHSLTLESNVSQSLECIRFSVLPSQNLACNYLESLLKYRFLGDTPRDPDSAVLGWTWEFAFPKKLPGGADAAGPHWVVRFKFNSLKTTWSEDLCLLTWFTEAGHRVCCSRTPPLVWD